jgi:hypothetical protein
MLLPRAPLPLHPSPHLQQRLRIPRFYRKVRSCQVAAQRPPLPFRQLSGRRRQPRAVKHTVAIPAPVRPLNTIPFASAEQQGSQQAAVNCPLEGRTRQAGRRREPGGAGGTVYGHEGARRWRRGGPAGGRPCGGGIGQGCAQAHGGCGRLFKAEELRHECVGCNNG